MPTESEIIDTPVEATAPAPRHPLRRSCQVLGALGAVALLSLFAREGRVPTPPASEAPDAALAPSFTPSVARAARPAVPITQTAPRYRLDGADAIEPVRAEPARLNPSSGQREDVLVQGGFSTIEAPYLRLTLTETPASEPARSLFVTLARRAADGQGLAVVRSGERGAIETKFGPVETLDITLGGEGRRSCTGFRSLKPGALSLDGWLCAPLGQAPEPRALTCALDKVALDGPVSPDLQGAFEAFEARRDAGCGASARAVRDPGGETGSLPARRPRKNEAKLRPSREARP